MPKRIQRKRTKGWKMPENTVSVTRPGRYGNPFVVGESGYFHERNITVTADNCLTLFERYCKDRSRLLPRWLEPLRGKDLACFCGEGEPCHGDILLRLANS